MSIKIASDDLLTVAEAVVFLRRSTHAATIHRWMHKGVNGVVLESALLGGQRITSKQAIQRFMEACTEKRDTP